jgi:hypothetical protein
MAIGACTSPGPVDTAKNFYNPDDSRAPAEIKAYALKGTCDGFPRIEGVKTAAGLCLGLVDNNTDPSIPMRRPRAIAAHGDDLIVVDMAGWQQLKGQVFLLKKRKNGAYRRFLLLDFAEFPKNLRHHFYMPSTVQKGPDGKVWVGATSSIFRFDPKAELFDGEASSKYEDPKQVQLRKLVRDSFEVVLDNLPYKTWVNDEDDSLHPLKPFVFSNDKTALYVGVGAATDNCGTNHLPSEECRESEARSDDRVEATAAMYRYPLDANFMPVGNPTLVARGLRNSLAIAIHPVSGELYQGENSRDIRGAVHASRLGPPDELNIVREDKHYGWPYCVGYGTLQKEYVGGNWDCSRYEAPHLLLPPHAAALQMMFYTGEKLNAWYRNKLIVPFHGREDFGHRLVSFEVGDDGRPTGHPLDMVYGWGSQAGGAVPLGNPMGIAQASDGSIFIVEDQSRRILRLSTVPAEGLGIPKPAVADQEWVKTNARR